MRKPLYRRNLLLILGLLHVYSPEYTSLWKQVSATRGYNAVRGFSWITPKFGGLKVSVSAIVSSLFASGKSKIPV
jgi:hypothetical protein